jgi:hypothetical protein
MAGIADSLNYGRFEFVDSDDEDYVEKSILKTALDPNSTSIATRNAAAHALAKKGELPARIGGAPSQIDKTLSATRLKMEAQLTNLTKEMEKLEQQQGQLMNIKSPEEAMDFIEVSKGRGAPGLWDLVGRSVISVVEVKLTPPSKQSQLDRNQG